MFCKIFLQNKHFEDLFSKLFIYLSISPSARVIDGILKLVPRRKLTSTASTSGSSIPIVHQFQIIKEKRERETEREKG